MDAADLASLRARVADLEKEVQALHRELDTLRREPTSDLAPTPGSAAGEPAPYSLSAPAAQPDLLTAAKPPEPAGELPAQHRTAKKEPAPPVMSLEEAQKIVLDGYILDHPGDADRLLKTLVLRLLDGSVKGLKSKDLPAARIVARSILDQAGIRSTGQGFNDGSLRAHMRKFIPFAPITSIRRLPR